MGISPQGFYDKLEKDYFTSKDLEKLANLFGVDIAYFFGAKELEMAECYKIPVKAYAGFLSNGFENIQVMAHELETVAVPKKWSKIHKKRLYLRFLGIVCSQN